MTLAVILMSIYKPIVVAIVLSGWAWVAGWFDKDLVRFSLQRRLWNCMQFGVAVLAFGSWLLIVYFWVGFILALVLLLAAFFSYFFYRNSQVPATARWTFSLDFIRDRLQEAQAAQATKRATMHLLTADGKELDMPPPTDPAAPGHELLQQLVDFALPRGGDRIDLLVDTRKCSSAVHIDGVKFAQAEVEPRIGVSLLDHLKSQCGLDMEERRRRQNGEMLVDVEDHGRHHLDLAFTGSTRGLGLSIYLDQQARTLLTFDQLGLLEPQKQRLQPVLDESRGTVIVACPVKMGMTTTIYSLVNTHDPYTQSVVTLEDQIALHLEGVNHHEIESGTEGAALNERLAAMLRGDPQVVMLSRLADARMSQQFVEVSDSVRFYVGLTQPDTFAALRTWVKAVGDRKRGGEALAAIISQRLVRKLCPVCRVAYQPDVEALRKLNLPPERVKQLFKHSGQIMVRDKPQPCSNCHGLGYRGLVGVFEIMIVDEVAQKLIAEGDVHNLRAHLRRQKMLWLQEAALYKAVEGVTSISEITRALGGEGK